MPAHDRPFHVPCRAEGLVDELQAELSRMPLRGPNMHGTVGDMFRDQLAAIKESAAIWQEQERLELMARPVAARVDADTGEIEFVAREDIHDDPEGPPG